VNGSKHMKSTLSQSSLYRPKNIGHRTFDTGNGSNDKA